jgi:hypothetical protein
MERRVFLALGAALLLAAGPTVRPAGAVLRAGCAADGEERGRLAGGARVVILYAFSGEAGACFKVRAGDVEGFLFSDEIEGLEEYRSGLRAASDRELPQMIRAEVTRLRAASEGRPAELNVVQLLETSRPREALKVIEERLLPAARAAGIRDANLLAVAGLAAFQSDQPRRAAEYWAESLELRPDPAVERLYAKVRGELKSDTSRERVSSQRFDLRYDGGAVNSASASELLDGLNEEAERLRLALGCAFDEKITAIVQELDAYRATTGAEEWSGGQFDGRIRVVLDGGRVTRRTRAALAHELVHACLARHGRFERWFHEGMAQRHSGERPGAAALSEAARREAMPDWRKSNDEARLFYAWSWLAVERLYTVHGDASVRMWLRNPGALPAPRIN